MFHAGRVLLPLVPLVALACGDGSPAPAGAPPATATLPPAGTVASYRVPTDADQVVISAGYEGGFAPRGAVFAQTPLAVVTGDGRVLTSGPVPAIYPGPLLPNIQERTITPEAVQQLVAKADALGLLRDVEYARNDTVADAPDTYLDITVGGRTYRHRAYALGVDGGTEDPDRQHLLTFVDALGDLSDTVGSAALGPERPFGPERYLVQATPVEPPTLGTGVAPRIVPWPADAPVRLADAATCALLPADVATPRFEDADLRTYFNDAGITYAVAAVQQLPGRTC
jgi:hypothetical protein